MSGSKGNYIALVEGPNEQFGKAMRLPDELLETYYRLVMESRRAAAATRSRRSSRSPASSSRRAHGEEAARAAEEHFTRVVREGQAPEEVVEIDAARGPIRSTCRACSSTASGSALRARPAG